jgi:hypothetical protein
MFIPPVHFSNVILQRGTIIILGAAGVAADAPVIPMPGMPIKFRSVIMVVIVQVLFLLLSRHSNSADPRIYLDFGTPDSSDQYLSRKIFDYRS